MQSIDIDHTWVHVSGVLGDGKRVYITAWKSKTGGDYKFADVMVVNPDTGVAKKVFQWNEEDIGFNLNFESTRQEQEALPGQEYQMAHGGRVVATLNGNSLFELQIDGDPEQTIDGKGMLNMVEAHGRVVSASVLGIPVHGDTVVWETSEEGYSTFLPLITK